MDILCLLLFEPPEPLLVSIQQASRWRCDNTEANLEMGVRKIITTGAGTDYEIDDMVSWALTLIGHNDEHDNREKSICIVSSEKKQVVYSKPLSTKTIRGYIDIHMGSWAFTV
jgi:hypothetical protein